MTENDRSLIKVWVEVDSHWHPEGELLSALPLGHSRYELREIPVRAYGLNLLDVVEAAAAVGRSEPEVRSVVEPSGHTTLRVMFFPHLAESHRQAVLRGLTELGVSYRAVPPRLYALDLGRAAELPRVVEALDSATSRGWLAYESCEARALGAFGRPRQV